VLAAFLLPAVVQLGSTDGRSELAHALLGASLQVESGMVASVSEGTPASAFQPSVHTGKWDTDVIVDSVRPH